MNSVTATGYLLRRTKALHGVNQIWPKSAVIGIETLLMDDAPLRRHVREQCRIRIPSDEPAYGALRRYSRMSWKCKASGPTQILQ